MSNNNREAKIVSDLLGKDFQKVYVNEDILQEILLRLPLKPLHRCRSLSKFSNFCISSPHFIKTYFLSRRTHVAPLTLGFFYHSHNVPHKDAEQLMIKFFPASEEGKKLKQIGGQKMFGMPTFDESLNFVKKHSPDNNMVVDFIASSNGLILYKCLPRFINYDYRYYCVCNPITKQWRPLPKPPNTEWHCLVEGFICESNTITYPCLDWVSYKVVRCVQEENFFFPLDVEIFSSVTGNWIELKLSTSFPNQSIRPFWPTVISDSGIVCFIGFLGDIYGEITDYSYCIAFNLNEEIKQLHVIRNPAPCETTMKLGYCEGRINLVMGDLASKYFLQVWQLNEETKWSLKYKINNLEEVFSQYSGHPRLVAIHPVNSSLVLLAFNHRERVLLDTKNRSLELISEFSSGHTEGEHVPYYWPCWPPLAI